MSLTSLVKLINNLQIQQPEISFSLYLSLPLFSFSDFLFFFCFLFYVFSMELWWFVSDLLWVGVFSFEQHLSGLWVNEWLGVGTFTCCWRCDHYGAVGGTSIWGVSCLFDKRSYRPQVSSCINHIQPSKADNFKISFFFFFFYFCW